MTQVRIQSREAAEPGESERTPAEAITLGYLSCPQTPDKGFAGGLLVTDERTRPLHFAYVSPIRPTAMQRVLYGGTLGTHVRIDIIAHKLLAEGLTVFPTVVFVDADELVEARRISRWPVAALTLGPHDPTSLSTLRYNTRDNTPDSNAVGRIVAALEESVNLLDPFARLREALKEALKGEIV